jgi:hypothetical protein
MATKRMTKSQLRVAVAKDVLKSLNILKPAHGHGYVRSDKEAAVSIVEKGGDDSKAIAESLKKHCNVCALGACLLSTVSLFNKFKFVSERSWWSDAAYVRVNDDDLTERLGKVFTMSQMGLIEMAYEKVEVGVGLQIPGFCARQGVKDAIAFGKKYRGARARLEAIMKNIVKNKGEFIP